MRVALLSVLILAGAAFLVPEFRCGAIDPCGVVRPQARYAGARQDQVSGPIATAPAGLVSDAPSLAAGGGYDGQWVADLPEQGKCPAAHMTLFVHGTTIDGSVANPAGTFAVTGEIDESGNGHIKIGDFAGRVMFSDDRFAADYLNNCGERRAIGRKLTGAGRGL